MKKFNVYTVYIDDGEHIYKEITPAENADAAEEYWKGNGAVVAAIEEETRVEIQGLADILTEAGASQKSIDLITRTIEAVGLAK